MAVVNETNLVTTVLAGAGISVFQSDIRSQAINSTITNTGATSVAGTANEITASASTGAITLSIPAAFIAPGSITATTSLKNLGLSILPVTPVTVANAGTVNLSSTVTLNVLRPTGDSTISGAVINLPTAGLVDGQICTVTTTAAITTVTGTLSSAPVPTVVTLAAGQRVSFVYNLAATTWLPA